MGNLKRMKSKKFVVLFPPTQEEMSSKLVEDGNVYCPLCGGVFAESKYLWAVFDEVKQRWLANMVTHYRHEHVTYYNNGVSYVSMFHDYGAFKHLANERAKRQILRKCTGFLKRHGFTAADFTALQGTDQKTLNLANKLLNMKTAVPSPTEQAPPIKIRSITVMVNLSSFTIYLNGQSSHIGEGSLTVSPPTATINSLSVNIQHRHIGTATVNCVETFLEKNGVQTVTLEAAEAVTGFWEKMGYHTTTLIGEGLFKMEKDLHPQTSPHEKREEPYNEEKR
jgi:hypothetical protein